MYLDTILTNLNHDEKFRQFFLEHGFQAVLERYSKDTNSMQKELNTCAHRMAINLTRHSEITERGTN